MNAQIPANDLLVVDQIQTYIGQFHILKTFPSAFRRGSITVMLGRNGAGKTTTLKSIIGWRHEKEKLFSTEWNSRASRL